MRKIVVLIPFFLFAACGGLDRVNLGGDASAQAGAGGVGGSVETDTPCSCSDESNGTRLSRIYTIGSDGSKMSTSKWHDNGLQLDCEFDTMPNGDTFCLPRHEVVDTYLDPGCTIPVYVWFEDRCDEMPVFVRYDERFPSQSNCPGEFFKSTFFRVGAETPAPPGMNNFFRKKNNQCAQEALFKPFRYFELTTTGGTDQFVSGTTWH